MEKITPDLITPRSKTDFNDPFFLDPIWDLFDYRVNVYFMVLAAVQRGLEVTQWGTAQAARNTRWPHLRSRHPSLFTVSDGKKTHLFHQTMGDLTPQNAATMARDKVATKKILQDNNILTPAGFFVDGRNAKRVPDFLADCDAERFITKPHAGSLSKHIGRNMTRDRVQNLVDRTPKGKFIIEEMIQGTEYRVFVVGDRVAGAFKRVPPGVIGNGRDRIIDLIQARNKLRANQAHYVNRQIDIPPIIDFLSKAGISVQSVPVFGKKVLLSDGFNVRKGAVYQDVLYDLPLSVAKTAIRANKAMDHPNSGMDVIFRDGKAYVLEVNTRAHIQTHGLQEIGKNLDNSVAEAVIDAYFPSTEPIVRDINIGVDAKAMVDAFEEGGYDTVDRIVPVKRGGKL